MPKVRVKYFLTFKDITGKMEEEIVLDGEGTVDELLKLLIKKYGKKFERSILDEKEQLSPYLKILVNEKEAGPKAKLEENDVVYILFPPSGGKGK
ncbi:MAG: MoaD family protein [Candidatus Hadarchaeum sp.]|uniref:MoaD family protein n=1 Tax=Candidatus Hadarchaeum sp. TaxID=2883567 RepID=UPI003173A5F3